MASKLVPHVKPDQIVMDPTCGIGDLLIGYAATLPLGESLCETISNWGLVLAGLDLDPELVRLAKARIVAFARIKGNFTDSLESVDDAFPLIKSGNFFSDFAELKRPSAFLFNPPFVATNSPTELTWASGLVNNAAVFLAKLIQEKRPEAPISAILPEVLRSGTRYKRFREHIASAGVSGDVEMLGRFDRWTDVDVFSTLLHSSIEPKLWVPKIESPNGAVVGDFFSVNVGPVVPHRHPNKGQWSRFICAKTTPRWNLSFEPKLNRRFKGKLFRPPFVVVRRTSSPSDNDRAVATVVTGKKDVAVENHLLVLTPASHRLEACVNLALQLKEKSTTSFLNKAIRCRHLTTGVVSQIPYRPEDGR